MTTKTSNATSKPTARASSPLTAAGAFQVLEAEIDAVEDHELVSIDIDIDIATACATGLGAAALVPPLMKDLAKLIDFDADRVARLRTYALAALYANAVHAASLKDQTSDQLVAEASPTGDEAFGSPRHDTPGARETTTRTHGASKDLKAIRQRAFSLFVRVYTECRRGVSFLRWYDGDADEYVPFLYPRRHRLTRSERQEESVDGPADLGVEEDANERGG